MAFLVKLVRLSLKKKREPDGTENWAQHPSDIQLSLFPTALALKLGFAFQNLVFVLFVLESWSQRQKAVYYLLGHTARKREGCLCWAC